MRLGGGARRTVRPRQRRGRRERRGDRGLVVRLDEHARLGCDELGRAADPGGDDGAAARHRLERREPERLDEARLADDVGGRQPARDERVRNGSREHDIRPTLERRSERPVTDEGERALAMARERVREARGRSCARRAYRGRETRCRPVASRPPRAPRLRPRGANRRRSTPQSITSIFPAASGTTARSRLRSQPETATTAFARRTASRVALRDQTRALRVRDVLAVGREDGRRPARERAEQPGGDQEVPVDDVRTEAARRPGDVAGEKQVTRSPAAPVDDGAGELVSPLLEPCLEVGDERPERRGARPGVHLGDEQDPHAVLATGQPRVTCRTPRHISSVVPSPQRM